MNKSNPKMILNIKIDNGEFEDKVKLAMDEYAEKLIVKNLDGIICSIVNKRISNLINGAPYSNDRNINGKTFDEYVKEKTEDKINEIIDNNIREIFASKLAAMLYEV